MEMERWVREFSGAVTVCDAQGTIVEMNDRAILLFDKYGGAALIGRNVLDCHPEPARTKLQQMLVDQKPNVYTVAKNGTHKLICQAPWYSDGQFGGIVELVFETPAAIPHFVRPD